MNATVLITGGASGIGLAIAKRVVERGARVVIWDVSAGAIDKACKQLGPLAEGHNINVCDPAAVKSASLVSVTHLVNNAGIIGNHMEWTDFDPSVIRRILEVNVIGLMTVTSAYLKARISHPTNAVLNLTSIAGHNGGAPGFAAYGASKGAVISLTRAMARDLAPDVRVNAIAPGIIDTPIQKTVLKTPQARANSTTTIPLQRMGTPDEVAASAEFVLFDASYISGEIIRVSGGKR